MLKRNSKKILDIIAGQEERNAAAAYQKVHPKASITTARSNVSQLLAKPEAQIYLEEHIRKARDRIVELVGSEKQDIALRASQDILDREKGKATQKVETTSAVVTLNLSLADIAQ